MNVHWVTDRLAVSKAPSDEDLHALRAQGFRSIVDLRSDGEPHPQGVPPWDEAVRAREAGLAYHQIPIEPQVLGAGLAYAVRNAVTKLPGPVLLHCTSGRRAGTVGLALLACDTDLTIDECLARGRAMGLDFDGMPRLTAFLRSFVERHGHRLRATVA